MKYPIFASFIILTLVIRHAIRRNRRLDENSRHSFWDIERAANEVRRKPLDDLIFVVPDMSRFPLSVMEDDEIVSAYPDANNHSIDMVRYAMERVYKRKGQ